MYTLVGGEVIFDVPFEKYTLIWGTSKWRPPPPKYTLNISVDKHIFLRCFPNRNGNKNPTKTVLFFEPYLTVVGSAGGSAGGSADNVYFLPDTSKFDVVNVYIYMRGVGTKDTTPEWGSDDMISRHWSAGVLSYLVPLQWSVDLNS